MVKRYVVLAGLLAVVVAATMWFIDRGGIYPTKRINYRFEVTVETPAGPMTAYSVHSLVIQDTTMTPARNYQIDLDGEAVPFALPDGRYLFATLRPRGDVGMQQLFGITIGRSGYPFAKWIDVAEQFDARVPAEHLPTLAIIDASKEPETLRLVDDESEFRVLQARMISTDEPMTEEVANILPWLVDAIMAIPTLSTKTTDHHRLIVALKIGVRS